MLRRLPGRGLLEYHSILAHSQYSVNPDYYNIWPHSLPVGKTYPRSWLNPNTGVLLATLPTRLTGMASYRSKRSTLTSEPSPAAIQIDARSRRQSSTSNPSSAVVSPRVQLLPHSRTPSYDASFSPSDIELLANTSFDSKDVSSKDFDFEDVFTYDKPQRKLKSVVEVSSPTRDWSSFSSSHYQSAVAMRQKYNRTRSTAGEKYMKNQGDARKR